MSNIKEPYIISVWEEELIPVQDWYVKGTAITKEKYEELSEEDKKNFRLHNSFENYYLKEEGRISSEEYNKIIDNFESEYFLQGDGTYLDKQGNVITKGDYLQRLQKIKVQYEQYTVMEHYEETQGVIIGADNMESVFSAVNPIFKENVNGSVELTFSIYYKIFDPDALDFSMNPFIPMLTNEAKIKLKFRDKWYDLLIKNCVEDSTNYMFTYTCKDFYVNELSKNGFKVELDSELENNQGSVVELGKLILKDTDWEIDKEKSDIIVETKIEPLYVGNLKYDIYIKKINNYIPDVNVDLDPYPDTHWIKKNTPILFFYSDIVDRKEEPQILAVFERDENGFESYVSPSRETDYILDVNEDIITNGCNYRILYYRNGENNYKIEYADSSLKENLINIVDLNGLQIFELARAEKVVRSQKTGYDPDMDRFISKYYKKLENGEPDTSYEYYGYSKEDILRTDLAENLLANSDNFTSTDSGWVFDGVPEKRSKEKEAGYVGQLFQRTSINEANPNSGILFEESILEMNLKGADEARYYKDTSGIYYYVKVPDKDGAVEPKYILVDSDEAKIYEESVFDLYKKYQREGTSGYGDKTDDEIELMVRENLLSTRYSIGKRVAINTGVGANRDKIGQLSLGEEYVFAVSLGKFKEGEAPPNLGDKVTYGIEAPDAYYDFIEVESSGQFAYEATEKAIEEYEKDLENGIMKYYLENTEYQGAYQAKYDETYNGLKEDYKKRYLRTSGFSNDRTKKNWQPGGRRLSGWHGLWGDGYIGYYEIFLNVLRGFKPDDSHEDCCDPNFLNSLHTALLNVGTSASISKSVYQAFISGKTEIKDAEGTIHTYYQGLYPEMVARTILHSWEKQENVYYSQKSAYDVMGYDKGMYPDYDEKTNSLIPMTDSFNEFLFSEFYYAILNKWLTSVKGDPNTPYWSYTQDSKGELSSLLKSTYKACYENTNSIFESMEHTKGYQMPSAWNAKGGKYYQIHEATWVVKSKEAAAAHVKALEKTKGYFRNPFTGDEAVTSKEDFMASFCGASQDKNEDGEFIGSYTKYSDSLIDYCYDKEQDWLSTKTDTQIQSNDFIKQLKNKRIEWIEEFEEKEFQDYLALTGIELIRERYGGSWYCSNILGKFYTHWSDNKNVGTYTYNTDTYDLNLSTDAASAEGILESYHVPFEPLAVNSKIAWKPITHYTCINGATHYALLDDVNNEENRTGGYVFDREVTQVRLFDPYLDVLNATYIPQKSDEGSYVFDPFIQKYRPFRDWDSKEYRDPLTLELDNNTGVPGDKVLHPLRLFDGHIGEWYDTPTRYNMVRKYEDPNLTMLGGSPKYKFLTDDVTITEEGHYDGEKYEYEITYPRGYQYDVYVEAKKGKYIKQNDIPQETLFMRLFDLNRDGQIGVRFSYGDNFFGNLFTQTVEKIDNFFDKIHDSFKNLFKTEVENEDFKELSDAYANDYKDCDYKDEIDKNGAGLANSNADANLDLEDENDNRYDEDRVSIKVYGGGQEGTTVWGIGAPALDAVANASEFANAIKNGIAKLANKSKARAVSQEQKQEITTRYIKYKPYYWRHWGLQRYDYQPKICIQQTVDGIKTYKPYNNVEDKESEAYFVHEVEKDSDGNPIFPKNKNGEAIPAKNLIFLKNRRTTYRQRTETDYETVKYRMKKVDDMNKNYWIEAPNGEDYLRHYQFGDGTTKLFDGHLGRWVQCYSAFKVTSNSGDPTQGEEAGQDEYLDKFYMPYDNIMIPYNNRIFGATKQLTRVPKTYEGNNEEVYVFHNNIYMTLASYLLDAGYECSLNYNGLKVSFIDDYEYNSTKFATTVAEKRNKYLEFNLGTGPLSEDEPRGYQYIDLTVTDNTISDEVVKERWAYWISPVTKGFSLTEDPLSRLGMLFETSWIEDETNTSSRKENAVGRYIFLGMSMFKYVPYKTALEKITYAEPKSEEEQEKILAKAIHEVYEEYQLQTIKEFEEKVKKDWSSVLTEQEKLASLAAAAQKLNLTSTLASEDITVTISMNLENDTVEVEMKQKLEENEEEYKYITGDIKNSLLGKAILESDADNIYVNSINSVFKARLKSNPELLAFVNCTPLLSEKNITFLLNTENNSITLEMKEIANVEPEIIPLFPGQAPDAENLHFINYYIYDPDVVDHKDTAIFEYVGQEYDKYFAPAYDEDCQKIRSVKGKESNYFKLLQDCCDTFDCWMQKDIEHDPTTGQIVYRDKPIYTEIIENTEDVDSEPQVFVGEEALIEGTQTAARRLHHKLFGKIQIKDSNGDTSFKQDCEYEKLPDEDIELDAKEQKLLLQLNRKNNLKFTVQYMRVPDKKYYFKQYVGEEKWNGFKYGVNLKHIKRTIDSSQFSTRVIVKQNNNEFGKDKFCTIARASENPIKENFILDFSYYINNKLLDNSDLIGDLYTGVNTRLNYYPRLATLNRQRDEAIVKQSSLAVGLDNVTSKYETTVLLRDAALEEITKLTQLLTSSYDSYGQIISVPWKYNKSQEKTQKRQTSTPGATATISDSYGEIEYSFEINIPVITTVVDYPKYNDTVRNYLDQMDVYQREYTNSVKLLEELKPEKERIEAELAEIAAYLEDISNKKNELHKLFYHKYSRYIQEGSWVDENYIDDNLYYLDALSVSRVSAKPKVTYDIGVVDISAAYEYEEDRILLESELGDRTYIEDTEFFGYRKDDYTKPYWEMIIVTEKTYNITDPSQNQIQVKNYTTQFEDLFQTISATSQTLQLNEGSYGRVSTIVNDNGTIKEEVLRQSIADSDTILMNATNEDVKIDKTGVTITSTSNRANVVKLVSAGILVSSDGGNHYSTAITGDGINADLLLAGTLNTDKLLIGGRSNPNFLWNKLGISSFRTDEDKIDYSSFVRMDQYGIYGIKNYSKDGRPPENMSINDAFEPFKLKDITDNPNAVFGLTWEGFFLNASNGQGKVTIGTGQDFKMSEYSEDQSRWIDRVVIGKLNSSDCYGFQLRNSDDQVVMETDDTGELYLKRKLRISNFGEEKTVEPYGWVYADDDETNEGIPVNVPIIYQAKRENGELLFSRSWNDELEKYVDTPVMIDGTIQEEQPDGSIKTIYTYPQYTMEIEEDDNGGEIVVEITYGEPLTSFKSYFYSHETIIENGQKRYVKNYYTVFDGTLFATEPSDTNWEDGIKNQLDRVSLGIVDTYSRSLGFKKVDVEGIYSSSEYLTKVFSVKSNELVPLEQFTDTEIGEVIDKNENFALFDNGNLYAKNAWIEGNIRATDGTFKGKVYADEGELNDLSVLGTITVKGPYGTIKSETDGDSAWVINSDGTASFRNVKVSGKIETAIFEHEKVQTVAGTLLVTSQIPIKDDGIQLIGEYDYYAETTSQDAQNFRNRLTKEQEKIYIEQYISENPNASEEDARINTKDDVDKAVENILKEQTYKQENDKYILDQEGNYYLINDLNMFKVYIDAPAPQNKINIGINSPYKQFFKCKQEDGRLRIVEDGENNYDTYSKLDDNERNIINAERERLNKNNFAKVSLLEKFTISGDLNKTEKYNIVGYGNENAHYIKIVSNEDLTTIASKLKYVLFLGIFDVTSTQSEILGISINASGDNTYYPQDSIAIVNINNLAAPPKTLLGLFTSNLFGGTSNTLLIDDMVGQYGLYSDNAYIKGTMVSEDTDNGYIAGITTKNKILVQPEGKDKPEQVVFFAGQNINNTTNEIASKLKFYITREGTLYARDGVFEGIIRTSTIIGNGDTYGLNIVGNPNAETNAINFSIEDTNFLQFTSQRSFFYQDSNYGCLFSVLHNTQNKTNEKGETVPVSNYGIGMFGLNSYDCNSIEHYKLSFTQTEHEVQMKYLGIEVARIDATGVYIDNINDLGEHCECVEVINENQTIGINFKLIGIS